MSEAPPAPTDQSTPTSSTTNANVPERKGRFRVKQVEAAEGEEASYPEGDILGGRIKGSEPGVAHGPSSATSPLMMSSGGGADGGATGGGRGPPHRLGTGDMSAMSDLTDSLSKSSRHGGGTEKKGRFIIRELPDVAEGGTSGSQASGSSVGSHHVHIDPTPHVHHHHHHVHSSSRPPPHPHGHGHGHGYGGHHHGPHSGGGGHGHHAHHLHHLPRVASAQQLDGHSGGGSSLRPMSHMQHSQQHHLDESGGTGGAGTPHTDVQGYRGSSNSLELSSPTSVSGYSPHQQHHQHFQFASSSSLHDGGAEGAGAGAETIRMLKHQNDLILQRLLHMERSFHSHGPHPHHPSPSSTLGTSGGLLSSASSSGAMGTATTPGSGSDNKKMLHHHDSTLGMGVSSSSGTGKDITQGKLTYLLDQMKIEVEGAVSRRKELDLQMKRLQEKNRALEEKVDEEKRKRLEMEKKFEKMKQELAQAKAAAGGGGGGGLGGSGSQLGATAGGKDTHNTQSPPQPPSAQSPFVAPIPIASKPGTPDLPFSEDGHQLKPPSAAGLPPRVTSSPVSGGSSSGTSTPNSKAHSTGSGDPFDALVGNLGSGSGGAIGLGGGNGSNNNSSNNLRGRGTSDVSHNAASGGPGGKLQQSTGSAGTGGGQRRDSSSV